MKRRAYCCDASRRMYDYYTRQAGGEIPVFVGSRYQRGHGLGSVLGGFLRRFVIPLFTIHGKTLALDALRTGMDVAEDVLGGKHRLKESAKKRIPGRYKKNGTESDPSVWIGRRQERTQEKKKEEDKRR